jgi:hypothetical protein
MADFALAPFILDSDAYGYYISIVYVELAVGGLIEYFLNHPVGTLQQTVPFSPITGTFDFNSINPANNVMIYTDSALSYITFGNTYKVTIPNIKVQLKTGERCEITFVQEYTITV